MGSVTDTACDAAGSRARLDSGCPVCGAPPRLYHGQGRYCGPEHKREWERRVRAAGEHVLGRQLGLELLNPIVRASNPSSSHAGAELVTESGQREVDCLRVLAVLQRLDEPVTYSELAELVGLEKHAVQKRLNDLRREVPPRAANGPKRKCAVTGVSVQTWYALEVQEQEGQAA